VNSARNNWGRRQGGEERSRIKDLEREVREVRELREVREVRELREVREVRELRRANEILKSAAGCLGAELDRRSSRWPASSTGSAPPRG
jgi:hypothetical protein